MSQFCSSEVILSILFNAREIIIFCKSIFEKVRCVMGMCCIINSNWTVQPLVISIYTRIRLCILAASIYFIMFVYMFILLLDSISSRDEVYIVTGVVRIFCLLISSSC